jgi:alkanesulfonate monooxygenase SsuD/methylene tetrahydromethanopterin reductase-like flavin-dependent oxidoreductase (luciferase family)
MQEAWAAGDRKRALELIPDKVVDELVVHGEPGACRERVAEYQASGLDTPVIMVVPTPGVDEAEAVRQLAPGG